MPDEVTGAAPAAPAAGAVADATGTPPATSAPRSDEPVLNKQELVDARKEIREAKKSIDAMLTALQQKVQPPSPPAKPEPATADAAMNELKALREEMRFKDALAEKGISDPKQRKLLTRLYQGERPPDLDSWLSETLGDLGPGHTASPPAATPTIAAPSAPSDSGPPASSGSRDIPMDPARIPQSVVDAMTPEQAVDWWKRYKRQSGQFVHPFAHAKKSTGGDMNAAAKLIADALSKVGTNHG